MASKVIEFLWLRGCTAISLSAASGCRIMFTTPDGMPGRITVNTFNIIKRIDNQEKELFKTFEQLKREW